MTEAAVAARSCVPNRKFLVSSEDLVSRGEGATLFNEAEGLLLCLKISSGLLKSPRLVGDGVERPSSEGLISSTITSSYSSSGSIYDVCCSKPLFTDCCGDYYD